MPAVGADDSGEHELDYRRSRRGRKRSSLPQRLRQLGDVGGDAPKRARPRVCAQESSHRPRANQGGWLGASSKVMVFVGAPLASLAGTMSTRTRS